ncbi:MAG: hypothetical protein WC869_00890 [Phycisphaerae bacterium]|jgi:hypothetical protein
MDRSVIGFFVIVGAVFLIAMHSRPAPKIDKATAAEREVPRYHLWRGDKDADRTLDLEDSSGRHVARVLERDGLFYDEAGSPLRTKVTDDLNFVKTQYDIGTFAGFRPASRGYDRLDPFTAGLRFSPIRLGYDVVAPDLVITNDWAGAGASFFLPERIVGPDWKHLGLGLWYGYPFRGQADAPGGWTAGLSFSLR